MKKLVLTIAIMTFGMCQAQTTVFGSLGIVVDTVSALYTDLNGTDLYIGTKTAVPADRALVSNGTTVSSLGYNPTYTTQWHTGSHIRGIGTNGAGSVVFYDWFQLNSITSASTQAHEYNTSTTGWTYALTTMGVSTNNSVYAVEDNPWSAGSVVGGIFGSQQYPTAPSTSYNTIYSHDATINYPWGTIITGEVHDFAYHNTDLYACGSFSGPGNPGIIKVNNTGWAYNWTDANIMPANIAFYPKAMVSYGSELYIVIRSGSSPYTNFTDSIYAWDGITLTNTGIGSVMYASDMFNFTSIGGINDLEVHANVLYAGGDDLLSFDGVTWTTIPVNGTVYTLESYGTKLAIGGAFDDLDGNPALDNLAYLEETVITSVDVESSEQPTYTYTNGRLTIHQGTWKLYDLTGRIILNGGAGVYTVPVGIYILQTEYGISRIASIK